MDPIAKSNTKYQKRLKLRIKPIKTDFEDAVKEVEFHSSQEGELYSIYAMKFGKLKKKKHKHSNQ